MNPSSQSNLCTTHRVKSLHTGLSTKSRKSFSFSLGSDSLGASWASVIWVARESFAGGIFAMAQDMRSWIEQLDASGLLARITKPVDPRTQMGALLWQARDRALLFENLPGYQGWRCLGQAPGDVSLAPVAFCTARDEMIPEFVRRTEKLGTTRLVETGPVRQ